MNRAATALILALWLGGARADEASTLAARSHEANSRSVAETFRDRVLFGAQHSHPPPQVDSAEIARRPAIRDRILRRCQRSGECHVGATGLVVRDRALALPALGGTP